MKNIIYFITILAITWSPPIAAISPSQRDAIASGAYYFNTEEECLSGAAGQTIQASRNTVLSGAQQVDAAISFTGTTIDPTAIVLHWTAYEPGSASALIDGLRRRTEPSGPYTNGRAVQLYIDKQGVVHQLSEFLETRPLQTVSDQGWNDVSVAIEIESSNFGEDFDAYERDLINNEVQKTKVIEVVSQLMGIYNISTEQDLTNKRGIFGHYEIYSSNHDPGPDFMEEVRTSVSATSNSSSVSTTRLSSACSCPAGGTLIGSSNAEKVWNFFTSKGYTPEQTAGIVGNMQAESGIEPMRSQNYFDATISSEIVATGSWPGGPGWGLVQWTPASKMIDPSVGEGISFAEIDTVEHQVNFLFGQLEGEGLGASSNEKAAGDHLKQQTTVRDASTSFLQEYERAAKRNDPGEINLRAGFAQNYFNEFGTGQTSTGNISNSCSGSGGTTGVCGPAPTPYAGSFGKGRPSAQLQHMLNELRDKCSQFSEWIQSDAGTCWRNSPGSGHYDGTACDLSPERKWGQAICPDGDTQSCESGYQVANWLLTYTEELGTYYVIWDGKGAANKLNELHDESDPGFRWYGNTRYCGTRPQSYDEVLQYCGPVGGHFDHVHVSMRGGN